VTIDVTTRAAQLAAEPLRPAGPRRGHASGTVASIKEILAHRQLLGMLIKRELKAKYKDSTLGFIWSLLKPLAMLGIYYLALGQFMGAARNVPAFAIFIFTGLTAWGFFSEAITNGTNSIVANSGLVKKVYLPREIFPLASLGSALFYFAMQLVILLAAVAAVGYFPTGTRWIYAAMGLMVLIIFALLFSLLLSAINVYLRDVSYLVEIVIMIFFWVSPIVYNWFHVRDTLNSAGITGTSQRLILEVYLANPATLAVLGFQRTFWVQGDYAQMREVTRPICEYPYTEVYNEAFFVPQQVPDLAARLGLAILVGLLLLWVAHRVFARLQANFAQEL